MVAKNERKYFTSRMIVTCMAAAAMHITGSLGTSALGQGPDASDPVEVLTGGHEREWIADEKWELVLNDREGGCLSGKSWVFKRHGAGSHLECQDRRRVSRPFHWSLTEHSSAKDVYYLFVNGEKHELEFRTIEPIVEDATPIILAIVRTLTNGQREPFKEITLEYWER